MKKAYLGIVKPSQPSKISCTSGYAFSEGCLLKKKIIRIKFYIDLSQNKITHQTHYSCFDLDWINLELFILKFNFYSIIQ